HLAAPRGRGPGRRGRGRRRRRPADQAAVRGRAGARPPGRPRHRSRRPPRRPAVGDRRPRRRRAGAAGGHAVAAAGRGGQYRVPGPLPGAPVRRGPGPRARRPGRRRRRGPPSMTAVGIVPHTQRAAAYAERAARCLADRGVEVRVPAADALAIGLPELAWDVERFPAGLDFVLSLGGDGTMLRTVDLVAPEGVPVLGVNLGQLGFLTEIEPPQLEEALHRALAGEFT